MGAGAAIATGLASLGSAAIGSRSADKAQRYQQRATQDALWAEERRQIAEREEAQKRWEAEQDERMYQRSRTDARDRLLMGLASRYGFKPGGVNLKNVASMGRGGGGGGAPAMAAPSSASGAGIMAGGAPMVAPGGGMRPGGTSPEALAELEAARAASMQRRGMGGR